MDVTNIKVADLIPYQRNAKKHDQKQIDNVAESIRQFGMVQPIVVDKDNNIIIGHCRTLACQKLGIEEVPVVKLEDLTPEQANKLRLLDNKLKESEWDIELLAEDVPELDWSGFDIDWELPEVEEEPQEIIEDEVPEVDEEPQAKLGDIYQLGEHRLMCGDSTKEEDVEKLMDGIKADMVLTDPPYNVDVSNSKGMKIENDNMESSEFLEFLTKAFANIERSLKLGGAFYVWFASREHINFERALNNNGLIVRQELIWNKNCFVLSRQDYQWKHECCLYGWKEGAGHYFIDDRTQTTVIEDQKPNIKKMKKDEMAQLLEEIYSDKLSTTIINENKPLNNDLHPTMKPVKLIARLIANSSRKKEAVLDLFGGSGSTMMACEQLDRKCFTMEYDPQYVDVIIKRWEQFTGKKAVLLQEG